MMKLDILGTTYELIAQSERENPKLKDNDGIAELYSKRLIFDFQGKEDAMTFENIELYLQSVVRHELMHAFFHEAGLEKYSQDEILVDFIAKQFPKLEQLFDHSIIENVVKEFRNARKED